MRSLREKPLDYTSPAHLEIPMTTSYYSCPQGSQELYAVLVAHQSTQNKKSSRGTKMCGAFCARR